MKQVLYHWCVCFVRATRIVHARIVDSTRIADSTRTLLQQETTTQRKTLIQQPFGYHITRLRAAQRSDKLKREVNRRARTLRSDYNSKRPLRPTAVVAHHHLLVLPVLYLILKRLRMNGKAQRHRIARRCHVINEMVVLHVTASQQLYRKHHGGRCADGSIDPSALLLVLQDVNQGAAVTKMLLSFKLRNIQSTAPGIPPGRTTTSNSSSATSLISAFAVYSISSLRNDKRSPFRGRTSQPSSCPPKRPSPRPSLCAEHR